MVEKIELKRNDYFRKISGAEGLTPKEKREVLSMGRDALKVGVAALPLYFLKWFTILFAVFVVAKYLKVV